MRRFLRRAGLALAALTMLLTLASGPAQAHEFPCWDAVTDQWIDSGQEIETLQPDGAYRRWLCDDGNWIDKGIVKAD